ncbi:MAG: thiamine pyrophosphate-dependent enzyme, partial [Candidatus Zixiibacteriota bacterium]
VTQLFGDRALIGNATGCSSIYGGNLPTTPYTSRQDGRGPAWSNSLFEDAAEFAMGMRLAVDRLNIHALELLHKLCPNDFDDIANTDQSTQEGIELQRRKVMKLRDKVKAMSNPEAKRLLDIMDHLVKKSVWGFGGDGWAYDIGYGGLDHVMASGRNVNILVLDTEVYSNTGGQMSKSSPMGAVAKFAAAGRPLPKKDLGMMLMSYGNVYVAQVALGASHVQAVKAFTEAEAYNGPSIVIAYSHCIAHGIDMAHGLDEQKKAVNSGHWILYRYNPDLVKEGKNPLQLDSKPPSITYADYAYGEVRFRTLKASMPERAAKLLKQAQADAFRRYNYYKMLSELDFSEIYASHSE